MVEYIPDTLIYQANAITSSNVTINSDINLAGNGYKVTTISPSSSTDAVNLSYLNT